MKKISLISIAFVAILFLNSCKKDDVTSGGLPSNNLSVGKSAADFLQSGSFSKVRIQIAYMPGYAPDAASLTNLTNFINTYCNKPAGIEIVQNQIAASGKQTLTLNEIIAIEDANRTAFNSGNTLAVFVLYADADYNQNGVLGVAYKNTSMVVFGKTIVNNSGGINQVSRTKLESTGLLHEISHLFGLVNLGSPLSTPHEDAAHEKHCNNSACLMYFATQVNMMGGVLLSGPVPGLDTNCQNDLKANGGK